MYLKLYNYHLLLDATWDELDLIIIPVGTMLAVREPFFVGGIFSGPSELPFIKVDSPSDVVFIDANHPILRDVSWRGNFGPPSLSGEAWKANGTKQFKKGRWLSSAICFTKCIEVGYDVQVSRLNRSEVYLRLGWDNSAFKDAKMAFDSGALDESMKTKAVVRMVKAQYAMGQYDRILNIVELQPDDKACTEWATKARQRKEEQTSGTFDWVRLFKEAKGPLYCPDIGDFVGPIEVGFREGPQKLRGTFVSRDVKAGELLVSSGFRIPFRCC